VAGGEDVVGAAVAGKRQVDGRAVHLGIAAQVEFESRIEAKLKAVHHVLVSSAYF
jgi:hypothetical protein